MVSGRYLHSALALGALLGAAGRGWGAPETQIVRLAQKLQIPGATLESGEYTFSVEDRLRDRAILRIQARGSERRYYLLTTPSDKLGTATANGLIFFRSDAGEDGALKGWACPGCSMPLEVAYPKPEAVKITRKSGEPVLAVDPQYDKLPQNLSADDMKVVTLWLLSPKRITADHRGEGVAAAKYAAVESGPVETAQARAPMGPAHMPKTASNTAELALWGLLLTAAGLGLALDRKRTAG
ncbi:MAG: hypothetical protein JO340_15065 [Acidobacteriaceae bacterium]|nr:hypothetical protein [Acidobacteriaceae bacterium]